jgi:4-hydroxy-2-oxoheptanedioate aldolase
MIETVEALENLDDILTTPGVDAVYVGPADLSLSLGYEPGVDRTEPAVVKAQKTIAAACKLNGVVSGFHTVTPEYALKMIDDGYRFVTVATDFRLIAAQAAKAVKAVRKRVPAE